MTRWVLLAPRLLTPTRQLAPGRLVIDGERIEAVLDGVGPADVVVGSGIVAPGFVDLQVNGAAGVDLAGAEPSGWATVARELARHGTTSFLGTFVSEPVTSLVGTLGRAREAAGLAPDRQGPAADAAGPATDDRGWAGAGPGWTGGARPLGLHLEGPWLDPAHRGAHREAVLSYPTPGDVERVLAAGRGAIAMVTLAPELPTAGAAIARLTAAGVVVSMGHSGASAQAAADGAAQGARMVTHLFNAMSPLHHRSPGLAGWALVDDRPTLGLIADLHHVAGPVLQLVFRAAPGRVALVSDATAALGMPPGRYRLGGEDVTMEGTDPPRRADGTLAGSTLRLDRAVANLVSLGIGEAEAITAATLTPAEVLGRRDLGRLAPGAAADLVWLGDDLAARATWVAGRLVAGSTDPRPGAQ